MSNFMKIIPVKAEMFHVDGRTDGERQTDRNDEANSCYSQFLNAPENRSRQ